MTEKKILLITSAGAEDGVQAIVNQINSTGKCIISIATVPISIAAFITEAHISKILYSVKELYDMILVPGLIPWDVSNISSKFKGRIKKGPRFIVNLPEILKMLPFNKFSSMNPADKVFKKRSTVDISTIIKKEKDRLIFDNPQDEVFFPLKDKKLNSSSIMFSGKTLPPVIVAEIIDAPKLEWEDISDKITHYLSTGADIIDLGAVFNERKSAFFSDIIPRIRKEYPELPISIDTLDSGEILSAIRAGANMVLSLTLKNYEKIVSEPSVPRDICIVLIPLNKKNKIEDLRELYSKVHSHGFTKIFLDPLIEPPISPGIIQSLKNYIELKENLENYPLKDEKGEIIFPQPQLFMGIGNITEIIDADSPGINALLSLMAVELDIACILSTEYSNKCKMSISELAQSIKLAYIAKMKRVPPLNIGIDAFKLKSKQKNYPYINNNEPIISCNSSNKEGGNLPFTPDPKGFFKIYVDNKKKKIFVSHYIKENKKWTVKTTYRGTKADCIYKKIIEDDKLSRLDHAAYLGKELALAEHSLKYGTKFIQSIK